MRVIHTQTELDPSAVESCTRVLRESGILCYPTETSYALGIDPWNELARQKLFALKGRETGKELPLIAENVAMVKRFCFTDHSLFHALSNRFWPGPLTLVLPGRNSPASCAVRVSAHPVARQISRAFQSPIVSTSANRSGEPPLRDPQDFPLWFAEGVEIMIDAGICPGSLPSTVLSLTENHPRLLREGVIPLNEIEALYETFKEHN